MMRKCPECGIYTMKEEHCNRTESVHPPRFSIEDKYGKYRRMAKLKGK